MRRVIEVIFGTSFVLCGCSVESIFEGGGLWFFVALVVLLLTAAVLGGMDDN